MTHAGEKGTTSINLVREALQAAMQRQLDVSAVLREARIEPALLDAPKARVPADAFARLWSGLADLLDDEFFGIDSHPMRRGSYRLMCHTVLDCDTLERALRRTLSFLRAVLDDIYGELHREGDHAVIVLHDHGVTRRLFGYGTWLILVHGLACWLVRRRIPIQELSFSAPAPADESDYRMRFCETVHFGSPVTQVRFDSLFLDLKLAQTPASAKAFLKAAPENILVKYRNDESINARVRRELRGIQPEAWPGLDDLARKLHMSSSTLQRRFQEDGTNYQRLKDDLRRDIAIDLLFSSSRTITEVAAEVGFQEASAFQRAFKKWTGVSPGAYRRQGADGPEVK
ncbi:AraC family transcriptional regulator [Paraburkholderia caribensis]|uniref:AraC family transcriptional regulator n=1 Tax=Paraburkholderia caribensis TaxID=75105 RepID=A0A9Q6S7T6_9BURK|nr:AraC family transcriptional regulator [Paraburkholderia caribensis]MCO4880107.1 AraC family transcriptional regulator [Paraburkholderia caribensis]PTB26270.1 AraC family transcriptional regulator [Paraburkholderia caribensis]QLB66111.1 AraC family transcriptional regulator [Paraburkholderia caribensis]